MTAKAWYTPLFYTHAPIILPVACLASKGQKDWDLFERNQVIQPAPKRKGLCYIARENTEDQSQLHIPQLGLEEEEADEP